MMFWPSFAPNSSSIFAIIWETGRSTNSTDRIVDNASSRHQDNLPDKHHQDIITGSAAYTTACLTNIRFIKKSWSESSLINVMFWKFIQANTQHDLLQHAIANTRVPFSCMLKIHHINNVQSRPRTPLKHWLIGLHRINTKYFTLPCVNCINMNCLFHPSFSL